MTSTETTTTTAPVANVTNLRETRKAMAASKKAHPAGTAKKQPVKKAAVKPAVEKRAYSAVSRSGKVATRNCAFEAKWAVDVADASASSAAAKLGLIYAMFADEASAKAGAERAIAKGLDAVVVAAKKA